MESRELRVCGALSHFLGNWFYSKPNFRHCH